MSSIRRWVIMTVLSLSGGIVFLLPFLQEVYYIPLATAGGTVLCKLSGLLDQPRDPRAVGYNHHLSFLGRNDSRDAQLGAA